MLSTTETILNKDEGFVHVAVDLAKKVFQVAYKDPSSGKFVNRQYKRTDLKIFYLTAAHLKSTYMSNHAEPVSTGADWQKLMVIKEL